MIPAGVLFGADNYTIIAAHFFMPALIMSVIVTTIVFVVIVAISRVPAMVASNFVANNTADDCPADDSYRTTVRKNGASDRTSPCSDSRTVTF